MKVKFKKLIRLMKVDLMILIQNSEMNMKDLKKKTMDFKMKLITIEMN